MLQSVYLSDMIHIITVFDIKTARAANPVFQGTQIGAFTIIRMVTCHCVWFTCHTCPTGSRFPHVFVSDCYLCRSLWTCCANLVSFLKISCMFDDDIPVIPSNRLYGIYPSKFVHPENISVNMNCRAVPDIPLNNSGGNGPFRFVAL